MLARVRYEGAGIIEIDIIVGIATGETSNIVEATHADYAIDVVRMAKCVVWGMVSGEARAGADQEGIGVSVDSER